MDCISEIELQNPAPTYYAHFDLAEKLINLGYERTRAPGPRKGTPLIEQWEHSTYQGSHIILMVRNFSLAARNHSVSVASAALQDNPPDFAYDQKLGVALWFEKTEVVKPAEPEMAQA